VSVSYIFYISGVDVSVSVSCQVSVSESMLHSPWLYGQHMGDIELVTLVNHNITSGVSLSLFHKDCDWPMSQILCHPSAAPIYTHPSSILFNIISFILRHVNHHRNHLKS